MIGDIHRIRYIKGMIDAVVLRLQIIHHKNQFNTILMAIEYALNVGDKGIFQEIAPCMEILVTCIISKECCMPKNFPTS